MNAVLKAHARHVLVEDFRQQFSSLVNAYVKAAEGLCGKQEFANQLADAATISGRNYEASPADVNLQIWTCLKTKGGWTLYSPTCGYDTVTEALADERAESVHIGNERVFSRDPQTNQWHIATEGE